MKYINSTVIILVVILVFGNTIFNGYNLDDELVTRKNQLVAQNKDNSVSQIFTSSYYEEGRLSYGYRPVTIASFYLEHKLFGESAGISHLINLILYTILVLLIYKLLILIFRNSNLYLLLFIALLFAIHPIHSEVVASIKNRDEILSLLFFVSSAILAMDWILRKKLYLLFGILLFVTLSILSKKSTLPLLFIFPLFIAIKEKLKLTQFLSLSCCFSLPISFFAFNFQWWRGIEVFLVFYSIYFIFYISQYFFENQKIRTPNTFEIISFLIVIVFLTIGAFYKDLLFFLMGQLFLITLFKNYFEQSLVFSLITSFLGFFVFYHSEFLIYSIIVCSTLAVKSRSDLKFKFIFLIPVLICSFLIAYQKGNCISILIYSIPILILLSAFINRFLPLIISLFSIIVSLLYFHLNYYNVGILISALFVSQLLIPIKWSKLLLAILIFSTCAFITQKQQAQNNSIFTSQKLLGQKELNIKENSTSLKEGRKLEFFENTLVAPHSLNERLATGIIVLNEYLRLMIFPKELSFYYGFSKINTTNFSNYWVWIGFVAHALLLFVGIYYAKKQPLITIGALWYVASIFIFSNHTILIAGMVGERLAFVASLGFCIFLGGLVQQVRPNFNFKRPRLAEILALLILVVFSARTIARNALWESHETLMTNDIEHLGNSAQANYLLAINTIKSNLQSHDQGEVFNNKVEFAIKHFNKAISIYPEVYNYHADLARAYIVIENYPEAKNSLIQANRLEPRDLFSLEEIIKISFELKEYADAVKYGELYIEEDERKPLVHELLAYSYYFNNQPAQAFRSAQNGLYYFPQNENLLSLVRNLSPQE